MLRLFTILILVVLAWPAWANVALELRVLGDSGRTRFVVDFEKNPDYGILRLGDPYRLVIDMPGVEFRDPAKPVKGRGLIKDFRYGLIAPGRARIVLDLSGPVDIVNTFVLDPLESQPARLVIDLVPTSAEIFRAEAARDRPVHDAVTARAGPAGPILSGKPVVVLDPGHGGIDSGAIGRDGMLEKDLTLKFAQALARELQQGGKVQPVLTRQRDEFMSLADRVKFARQHKANLFISVHADKVPEDYVRGATIYTLSEEASDRLSAATAEAENRSDILAGLALEDEPADVADILFDLAATDTRKRSVRFANGLIEDVKGEITLNGNPWRRASFLVLKAPEVPSVLLELGYLSNPEDEALFQDPRWAGRSVEAIAGAIEAFLAEDVAAGQ